MSILALSSHVAVGHVGNSAAVPTLERRGHDVWRVDTVAFSNHPGHHKFSGKIRDGHEIAELFRGIGNHTSWRGLEGVYSGYLGEAITGRALDRVFDRIVEENPEVVYLCDPVIGDHGRVFVREGIETMFRDHLVPRATVITPNAFELALLSGHRVETVQHAHDAAVTLLEWGPEVVVATGVPDGDHLAVIAVTATENLIARSPWHDRPFFGTGDLFAALFLSHYLETRSARSALAATVAGLEVATAATVAAGSVDLALIPTLDAIVTAKPAAVDDITTLL